MKERPILFSAPMVNAILAGRKTQTRRVVKPLPSWQVHSVCDPNGAADPWAVWFHYPDTDRVGHLRACPYGVPGDRLWVRETFSYLGKKGRGPIAYRANTSDGERVRVDSPWHPSIHMPRWASRLTLEITEVRVQRLQEISEEDAIAEGVEAGDSGLECTECDWIGFEDSRGVQESGPIDDPFLLCPRCGEVCAHHPLDELYRFGFLHLWDSINAKRGHGWEKNDWVWALSFRRVAA